MKNINKYILILLITFSSCYGNSIYVEKILGPASPEYIREYFERMYVWYSKSFFNFENHFSPTEKRILQLWKKDVSRWGVKVDKDFYRENFIFTHEIDSGEVQHGTLYIGKRKWLGNELKEVRKLLSEKSIQLREKVSLDTLLGIEWNFEKSIFSLYFLSKTDKKIHFLRFKKSRLFKEGFIKKSLDYSVPFSGENVGDIDSVTEIIVLGEKKRFVYRFRSFFTLFLSGEAQVLNIKHFKEFRQPLASIEIFSKSKYRIFYP